MTITEFRSKYAKEYPIYIDWAIQIYEKFGFNQVYANCKDSWIVNWQDYEIERYEMPTISSIEDLIEYCDEFYSWQYPYNPDNHPVTIIISESKIIDSDSDILELHV